MGKRISELTNTPTLQADDLFVIAQDSSVENRNVKAQAIKDFNNGWKKFSFSYTDFQPNATFQGELEVGLNIIPANGLVTGIKVKHTEAFGGGAITSAAVGVRSTDTGAPFTNSYLNSVDVFVLPAPDYGEQFTGTFGSPTFNKIPNVGATSKFYIHLILDGLSAIDDLTTGAVDVWIKVDELPI